MEFIINNKTVLEQLPALSPNGIAISSAELPFIEANTLQMSVKEISDQHIIPVWVSSNETLISHVEFIESVWDAVHRNFGGETILKPNVRVSHPIKGRVPEAKNKKVADLQPWEQTIYYERMMFVIEIPSITDTINGNKLSLMIGGVKSYNLDNLYGKRPSKSQTFQMFIGFQNKVCCNLCVSTDGVKIEHDIQSLSALRFGAEEMIQQFGAEKQLSSMKQFSNVMLSETEFAQIIGRSRMYKHLPEVEKKALPEMLFGDQQLGTVVHDFYHDKNFGNITGGELSMWDFYNLFTGANKSSYIDTFVDRAVNAQDFSNGVLKHKAQVQKFWYMG